jgi:transposase
MNGSPPGSLVRAHGRDWAGLSIRKAAKVFGVSPAKVQRVMAQLGPV